MAPTALKATAPATSPSTWTPATRPPVREVGQLDSKETGQIAVAFDANGKRVTDTQLVLDASGLETEIIIPRLSTVPEPASLVMAASATLLGLSYWWIRRRRLSADDTGR
jgi:hypothetical protein